MSITFILVITLALFSLELLYFKIADRYNIIDKPNHRSSHSEVTLRGGGIIFAIGLLLYPFYYGLEYIYFVTGLAAIASVSFIDDIKPVTSKLRIIIHLIAVGLMFYQLGLFKLEFYWIALALFLVIGSINAINFMDGINGITGSYALITLGTFLLINRYVVTFIESSVLITATLAVLVFNFFNFRKKAKCFAGDVGSVSIAFIVMFFLLELIIKSGNFNYLLMLLVYGLDTVTTIGFRVIRKEKILEPHRSHFYQYLANEKKIPHLVVSSIYSLIQLLVNFTIIFLMPDSTFVLIISLISCAIIFITLRFSTEGTSRLVRN